MQRVKLKTAWGVEAPAWTTDVPGLVVVRQAGTWWWVFSFTGHRVSRYAERTRDQVLALAAMFRGVSDWTTYAGNPSEELVGALYHKQMDFWATYDFTKKPRAKKEKADVDA